MAYKEKDTKKWTAQWFETNAKGEKKKRRKRGFSTKKEALEYERQKKLNSSRSMDMKLSEFMEVYFEDKQNELKERTMKNKRYMMEQHIIPYFGNQMMSEISASQIIQWQNEMQTKGFSESYLRMIQNQLTSLFTHASRIYDLHTNPCKKVTSECFMAISNGVADVCVVDLPTAQSAALTNDDLVIIQLDADDSFTGDDEMVNVCIATRKDDTALRDKIQDAMDAIGWNDKAKMDELMDTVLTQQPAAN